MVGGLWREVNYTVTQLMHGECGRICRGGRWRGGPYKRGTTVIRRVNGSTYTKDLLKGPYLAHFAITYTSSLPVPETKFNGSEGERLGQLIVTP